MRGDSYLRTLLIHGARAVHYATPRPDPSRQMLLDTGAHFHWPEEVKFDSSLPQFVLQE